jgi:hypothetical protein
MAEPMRKGRERNVIFYCRPRSALSSKAPALRAAFPITRLTSVSPASTSSPAVPFSQRSEKTASQPPWGQRPQAGQVATWSADAPTGEDAGVSSATSGSQGLRERHREGTIFLTSGKWSASPSGPHISPHPSCLPASLFSGNIPLMPDDAQTLQPPAAFPIDLAIEGAHDPGLSDIADDPHADVSPLISLQNADASPAALQEGLSAGGELVARADVDPNVPPESLEERLKRLRPWQAKYVLALMELGGVQALACRRCGVSRESAEGYQAKDPEFAAACEAAVAHSTDLVEAACFRGATVGDTQPIYQGGHLVGYKRVRNTRDAELVLRLRGKIDAQGAGEKAATTMPRAELPAKVADVMARIFGNRTAAVLDAETGKPIT